ncbi:Trm112 family protein [Arthrobacter sp. A5]|uniref:Trm112 family protein n=1 Tax=Arthrobacter sp. A5 TaxID=576926 RepID=UPI003DA90FFE
MPHVRDELLAVLRCPVTRSSLRQDGEELVSTVPGPDSHPLRYRIEDGIVLLLSPEQLSDAVAAGSDQHDAGATDAPSDATTFAAATSPDATSPDATPPMSSKEPRR